jgi:internalin A
LSEIDTETLAHLMHDLGYIVHYSDDEKLRDDVVLKPEWLTKAIGFVLEDRATAEREGILPDGAFIQGLARPSPSNEPRYDARPLSILPAPDGKVRCLLSPAR